MFPPLYHAHHQLHPEDLPFWHTLAQAQGGPILELGCGTGRVLIPLAEAGHTLTGLDNAPEMLTHLRAHLPAPLAPRVTLYEADLADFSLPGARFPLILLPCNTLSTFDSPHRRTALQAARRHLAAGGLFAASLPNPATLLDLEEEGEPELEDTFPHPHTGHPVQVWSAWQREGACLRFFWHYDHLLPDGQIERLTAAACHSRDPLEDYLADFAAAGLHVTARYGDFARSSYDDDSPALILLAEASSEP